MSSFEEVIAYKFNRDNFDNILFSIEECSVDDVVLENSETFEDGVRYGWPGDWNRSIRSSIDYLRASSAKAFEISSSLGCPAGLSLKR